MDTWHALIIEDDPDGQDVVSRIFTYNQISHDLADNAEDALQLVENNHYTVAIVDLALPGIDGWGFLKAVQETVNIPCIAITAYHSPEVAIKAIESGFKAYFSKPIDTTSFMREIERVMSDG